MFIVTGAFYNLKLDKYSFREYMEANLDDMGFQSTHMDSGVWNIPLVKSNGEEYYECVFMYADDLLAIRKVPKLILDEINTTFNFKNNEVEYPPKYLRGIFQKKYINGQECCDYVNAVLKNVEEA